MKPKTMILMGVAITCGLAASYMTSQLLKERTPPEEQPKVMVLVARKNLDMGIIIKNPHDFFQEKGYPQGEEPKDAIRKFDDLKGRVLKRPLRPGDWISPNELLGEHEGGISYAMPEGHRAVGLRMNLPDIAGGFASLPHSRVDIICRVSGSDNRSSFAKVLLQNVLVLAVDSQNHRSEGSHAMPGSVVTVALTPKDVLKVTAVKDMSSLSLVLRKFNDQAHTEVDKVSVHDSLNDRPAQVASNEEDPDAEGLVTAPLPEPKVDAKVETKVAKAEPPGRLFRVRIVEGDRISYKNFRLDDNDNVIATEAVRPETPEQPQQPPQPQPQSSPAVQAQVPAAPTPPQAPKGPAKAND